MDYLSKISRKIVSNQIRQENCIVHTGNTCARSCRIAGSFCFIWFSKRERFCFGTVTCGDGTTGSGDIQINIEKASSGTSGSVGISATVASLTFGVKGSSISPTQFSASLKASPSASFTAERYRSLVQ